MLTWYDGGTTGMAILCSSVSETALQQYATPAEWARWLLVLMDSEAIVDGSDTGTSYCLG